MKKQIITLCTFLFFGSTVSSQTESGLLNQSKDIEIGLVKDLRVSVIKKNTLSGAGSQKNVRLAYLPKKAKASDMFANFADTTELASFISSLKTLRQHADSVNENDLSHPELGFETSKGISVSCYLEYAKTQALAGSGQAGTNEKMYVETTDRMYEGKTVYKDVNGTFVWKPVLLTPSTNKTKDGFVIRGKRSYSIQLQQYVGASKMTLSSFEFKELITLLETAKTKMTS